MPPWPCWCLLLRPCLWLWLACAPAIGWADGDATAALHLQRAWVATQPAERFAPAPPTLADGWTASLAWSEVDLPHVWQRSVLDLQAGPQPVRTAWLRIDLAAADSSAAARYLYLPRWQTIGQIAIYADQRLVYRSTGDLVWNGFNHPLLVALDLPGQAPARWLTLRVDSQASAGAALSSAWVGPREALEPSFRWRNALQVRLPELSSAAVAGLGGFALAVWLLRRRESMYLLFAAFTFVSILRGLHFHLGDGALPLPSAWFGWMTVNAVTAMLIIWFYFVSALVPLRARWIGPALCTLMAVAGIATLPPLAVLPGMDVLAPSAYLLAIAAGLPTVLYLAWSAWRDGGLEGRLAAAVGVLDACVAVHDWLMQNHLVGPESLYLNPMLSVVRLLMFGYVILRRYVGAANEAEQASLRLAQRLRAREAELAVSYERLREVQQRQLLVDERQRLMQDIHDGMGSQLMSALRVAESGQLSDLRMAQVLRECIDDLKLTVDSLEPAEADLLLLLATLRYRLEPRLQHAGIALRWEVQDLPALDWLDPRSALHILRILQEGIANVIQHAGAATLCVRTQLQASGVCVLLVDDGRGFDAERHRPAGKGLSNVQRRAEAIGGRVVWDSVARGSCLRLWLPLQRDPPVARTA